MSKSTTTEHASRPSTPMRTCRAWPRRIQRPRRLVAILLLMSAIVVAAAALPSEASAQCAMCRTAFDSPEGRKMVRSYQAGIAFLLAVPFATFGTVAFFAVRGKKKLDDAEPEA